MTEKVFLSYAPDDRAFAEALKPRLGEFLDASGSLDVFDALSDIELGEDIRKALKAQMDAANTVVIVASPAGDASQWVNYEAGLADALGKKIVIVKREGDGMSALSQRFIDRAQLFAFDN
jgi:hypothetical protein